jgi:PAT family beta-lactamase induction signal transducer AmpG
MSQTEPGAAAATVANQPSFLQSLAVFLERRSLVMLLLGFGSGLPNLMIFDTLSAWLRTAGLSLNVIAVFSLATLAYSAKFLWAPLVDRTQVPVLGRLLGHRRSWMLVAQGAVLAALLLVSTSNPVANLSLMALFAVLAGFAGATQDIVVDAWRIEVADVSRQGAMATAYQWGYRVAIIVAGAVPLFLSTRIGWSGAFGLTSALMLVAIGAVLFAPREAAHSIRPIHAEGVPVRPLADNLEIFARLVIFIVGGAIAGSALAGKADLMTAVLHALGQGAFGDWLKGVWESRTVGIYWQLAGLAVGFVVIFMGACPIPGVATRPGVFFSKALGEPLADFYQRYGSQPATLILALICLYRVSEFVLNVMNPFYLDLGFTADQVAEARKFFGVVMSLLGVFLGGLSIRRLGLLRSMIIGAFAGPLSHVGFMWLALQGPNFNALLVAIGMDNIAAGYSGTCLIAYMSSLTGEGFTATQYALFSSLYALPGKLLASQSGRIIEGSAHNADEGGIIAPLRTLFAHAQPTAFAHAMERSQVSPAGLGAGYMTFFIYSIVIGVVGVILAFVVGVRGSRPVAPPTDGPAPDQATQTT